MLRARQCAKHRVSAVTSVPVPQCFTYHLSQHSPEACSSKPFLGASRTIGSISFVEQRTQCALLSLALKLLPKVYLEERRDKCNWPAEARRLWGEVLLFRGNGWEAASQLVLVTSWEPNCTYNQSLKCESRALCPFSPAGWAAERLRKPFGREAAAPLSSFHIMFHPLDLFFSIL